MVDCYVGMGGNFTTTLSVMRQVVALLKQENEITELHLSRLYCTTPISDIPQPLYLNAVCVSNTTFPNALWKILQNLNRDGKKAKTKKCLPPRSISTYFSMGLWWKYTEWIIPHPRWHERLFVIAPLPM